MENNHINFNDQQREVIQTFNRHFSNLSNLLFGFSASRENVVYQQCRMKQEYTSRFTKQTSKFQYSNSFILFPSAVAWLIGEIWAKTDPSHTEVIIPKKNLIYVSGLIVLSTLCMTKAIYVTNFPLVILFKSCNILSVIVVGVFCSRVLQKSQKLGKKKIITGLIITIGVLFYHFGGKAKQEEQKQNTITGILLLVLSLVIDGFVPDFQAEIKTKFQPNTIQMFRDASKWKTIVSLSYSLITLQLPGIFKYFYQYPQLMFHIFLLCISGTLGQMVVYWMINNFKQHVVPFVTTSRKIFSVVISIIFFNHESYKVQNIGIAIVFSVVLFDFIQEISGGKPAAIQPNYAKTNQSDSNEQQDSIQTSNEFQQFEVKEISIQTEEINETQ